MVSLLLLFPLLLCACDYGQPPKVKRNPVVLSADAQKTTVEVKHLGGIQTDIEDDVVESSRIIKNDWVTITFTPQVGEKKQYIAIEVKENISENSRVYPLRLLYKSWDTEFSIIQNGKTSE